MKLKGVIGTTGCRKVAKRQKNVGNHPKPYSYATPIVFLLYTVAQELKPLAKTPMGCGSLTNREGGTRA
jgi:hypothetical protein